MTEEAAHFVGSIPRYYDEFLGPRLFDAYAADLAGRVAATAPAAVLELAAGTGIVSRCLRDALAPDCTLVASDLNSPMLEVASKKFQSGDNISFETVDATELPYDDASFNAVACQFGVMFFPDKPRAYREVQRVLRPGGKYIFNVWGSWAQNPFAQIAHETVAGIFPDDPPGFYRVPFGYNDAGVIEEALLAAGFVSVSTQSLRITSAVGSAREFASGLVHGNPLSEEIRNRGGDPEQVCSAVAAALDARLGSSMSLEALIIEASKA